MSMNNRDKNLNELLAGLMAADEAAACREDLRKGDELLARAPLPRPRPELLADIKTQMLLAHHRKRHAHRLHFIYGPIAVAASLAIICGLAWFYVAGTRTSDLGLAMEPTSLAPISENIQSVTAQLDQIQDYITEVDSDSTAPAEYQTDIANLESSLWKG
jgi:hypothetical protein